MRRHGYTTKFELISSLQNIFEKKTNNSVYQNSDLLRNTEASADWGIELFLLRLLQQNTLSENPRSIAKLNVLWAEYQNEEQPSFTLKELKQHGWIRDVLDTYKLPFDVFRIVRKSEDLNLPTKFLNQLYEQPYEDERRFLISNETFQQIYNKHLGVYPTTPNIETIKNILYLVEENDYFIFDIHNFKFDGLKVWILSKIWSEKHYGPTDKLERLKWWLGYKKIIGFSDLQLLHKSDQSDFLNAVIELIIGEQDLWTLELEKIQLSAFLQARWRGEFSFTHDNVDFNLQEDSLAYLDYFAKGDYSHIDSVRYIFGELMDIGFRYAEYEETVEFFIKALDSPFLTRIITNESSYIPILLSNVSTLKIGIYSYMQLEQQEALDECSDLILHTMKTSDVREVVKQLIEILLYLKINALNERTTEKFGRFLSSFYKMLQDDKEFFNRIYPILLIELKQLYRLKKYTIESPLFWVSLDIFKVKEVEKDIAVFITNIYLATFDEKGDAYFSPLLENEIRKYNWIKILCLLSTKKKNQLFMPFDVEKNVGKEQIKYIALTRYHLQFLSFLSINVENATIKSMIDGNLAELLQILSGHKELNLFEKHIGIYKFNREPSFNLFENLWRAIDTFEDRQRSDYLEALQKADASFEYLATGVKVLSKFIDRQRVIQYITVKNPERELEEFYFTDDIQRNVEQLLQTEISDLANLTKPLINFCLTRGIEKNQYDLLHWAFSSLLRMLFLTEKYDEILVTSIPSIGENQKLIDSKKFYEALVYLKSDEIEKVKVASEIFKGFSDQDSLNIGHKINQLNALIRQFELAGEQNGLKDEILKISDALEKENLDTQSDEYRLYIENILYFNKISNDINGFLKKYYALEKHLKSSHIIGVFAIQVYIESEKYTEATKVLDDLITSYGNSDLLIQLQRDIECKINTVRELPDTNLNAPIRWGRIAEALELFKGKSDNNEKAKIYFSNELATKHDLIVNEVFRAIEVMNGLSPILNYYEDKKMKQGLEDDYNNLFCEILNQALKFYGWSCSTQSRGGYSAKVLGERDIIICSSGGEILAIIEAMRLTTNDKNNIMKHFKKTFSYDAEGARFYFLIVWGYSHKPIELFDSYCKHIRTWEDGELAIIRESKPEDEFMYIHSKYPPLAICTHHQNSYKQGILMTHIYVDVKQNGIRQTNVFK